MAYSRGNIAIFLSSLLLLLAPAPARCMVLTADTTWSGEVTLEEDVLVPKGVTLTILPATKVHVVAAESTKTDPEFLSPLTEIMVRGTLIADGKSGAAVTFDLAGDKRAKWAGIVVEDGAAVIRSAVIRDADTAVSVAGGSLTLADSLLTGNRYGLTVLGQGTTVKADRTKVVENDYGVVLMNGARIDGAGNEIGKNRKKDSYAPAAKDRQLQEKEYTAAAQRQDRTRTYGDETLLGTTIWQGRIAVNGIIRIPENARLIILPGTVVEFRKKDTNHDDIGENGILIQGVIVAKGTPERPIILRSAEARRAMGDWDAINIMNSDRTQNLVEYCQIEDAYRGLHFHFSNVTVAHVIIRNNYRGVQFQESVVEISGTSLYGNKSALQARDSDILFTGNTVRRNYTGMNLFRNSLTVRDCAIVDNYQEGLRVREGLPVIERNLIDGNRHGLMVSDALYGTFARNVISHNAESGILLRNTDAVEVSGNAVLANGINGINIQDSTASFQGNLIAGNGERGVGVQSFQGALTGNTIVQNGLYNLGIDGAANVSARSNWWGGGDDVKKTIFDKGNDPSKGSAEYLPMRDRPIEFEWPLRAVQRDAAWYGDIAVPERVVVDPGAELVLSPGTRVLFARKAGLTVRGKVLARGRTDAAISFTSDRGTGPGEWDEILLDHALGSVFTHCRFSHATWALHSHFTDLKVDDCSFSGNGGGVRFTSGPIEVTRSSFTGNDIGIRAYRGKALISGNVITGNRIGVFVREKGGGLAVRNNDLFANSDYNIRMGDFNTEDVDARNNWWGGREPASGIYDDRTEAGIGKVLYEPFAERPFSPQARSGNASDKQAGGARSK